MYSDDGIVEFWENQRFWGLTWGAPLLPFDWPAWSDSQGDAVRLARPPEREGERSWFIVRTLGTDEEGWRYSTVFSKLNTPRPGGRASKRSSDYVRSRVWRKLAAETPTQPDHELQLLQRPPLSGSSSVAGALDRDASLATLAAALRPDPTCGNLPAIATAGAAGCAAMAITAAAAGNGVKQQPRLQPEAERILLSAVAAAGITSGRHGGGGGALSKPSLFKLWQLFMELWKDACARHGMRRLVPLDPLGLYVAARRHRELLARQRLAQLAMGRLVAAAPVATEVEPDLLDAQSFVGNNGGQDEPEDAQIEARQQSAAALGELREAQAAGVDSKEAAQAAVAAAAAAAAAAASQHRSPTVGKTPTGAAIMQPAAPQPVTLHGGSRGVERRTTSITGPPGSGISAGAVGGAGAASGSAGDGDTVLSADQGLMPDLTDPATLLTELVTATNYSRAAYGYVMAAGHLNSLTKLLTMLGSAAHFNPITGASAEANLEAIHLFTGIPVEDVVMAEWRSSVFRPCHYLSVDRRRRRLVLAIRGSLELADIATDLTARPVEYNFGGGLVGHVHQGLMSAASYVQLNTAAALQSAAERFPGWPLLVTGHSLGAGVAALLTLLLLQRNRPMSAPAAVPVVHCLAIAPPAVLSANLAEAARGCCVSLVNQGDFVARLSCYSVDRALLELVQASPAAQMADNFLQSTGATLAAIQQRLAALGGAAAAGVGGGLGGGLGGGGFLGVSGLARGGGSHPSGDQSAPNLKGMEVEMVTTAGQVSDESMGLGAAADRFLRQAPLLQAPPPSLPAAAAALGGAIGSVCAGLKDIPLLTTDGIRRQDHHGHHHNQNYNQHFHHHRHHQQQQQQQQDRDLDTLNGSHNQQPQSQARARMVMGAAVASFPPHPNSSRPQTERPLSADGSRPPTQLVLVPGGGAVSDIDEDDTDDSLSDFTSASGPTGADSAVSFHSAPSPHESYISAASSPASRVSEDAADSGFWYRSVQASTLVLPDIATRLQLHRPRTPVDGPGHQLCHSHHSHHNYHHRHQNQERSSHCHATAAGLAAAAAAAAVGGVPYAAHAAALQEHARHQGVLPQPSASRAIQVPPRGCGGGSDGVYVIASQGPRQDFNRFAALTPPANSPADDDGGTERLMEASGWNLSGTARVAPALQQREVPGLSHRRSSDPLSCRGQLHREAEEAFAATGSGDASLRDRFGFGGSPGTRGVRSRGDVGGDGTDRLISWEALSQKLMTSWFGKGVLEDEDEDEEGDVINEAHGDVAAAAASGDNASGAGGFGGWWLSAVTGTSPPVLAAAEQPQGATGAVVGRSTAMTSCWPGLEEPPGPHRHQDAVGGTLRGKYGAVTQGSGSLRWAEPQRQANSQDISATGPPYNRFPSDQQQPLAPNQTQQRQTPALQCAGEGASGSRPTGKRLSLHRPSRSMPAHEMPEVTTNGGKSLGLDREREDRAEGKNLGWPGIAAGGRPSSVAAATDTAVHQTASGDDGTAAAQEVPDYLHSAHKELYPPGRVLWMVVDNFEALPPPLRQRVPGCGYLRKHGATDDSDDSKSNDAISADAEVVSDAKRTEAATAIRGPASSIGGSAGHATASNQTRNSDAGESAANHMWRQQRSDEENRSHSLRDMSLASDSMRGLVASPSTALAAVAVAQPQPPGVAASRNPGTQATVEAPMPLKASRWVDSAATAPAAAVAAKPSLGGGTAASFQDCSVPSTVTAVAPEEEPVALKSPCGSLSGEFRQGPQVTGAAVPAAIPTVPQQRNSISGAYLDSQMAASSAYDDAWRAEVSSSPSAIDACAASVAAVVAGSGPGGGGGIASGSTPFTARVREGLQRIKSGVETMLRQAPLPAVPSMQFLQGSSQLLATAGGDLSYGGGAASGEDGPGAASIDPDAALFGVHSTAAGQQQPSHGSQAQGQGQWLFLVEADREVFDRMILIPASVTDHLPDAYFQRLQQLVKGSMAAAAISAGASASGLTPPAAAATNAAISKVDGEL